MVQMVEHGGNLDRRSANYAARMACRPWRGSCWDLWAVQAKAWPRSSRVCFAAGLAWLTLLSTTPSFAWAPVFPGPLFSITWLQLQASLTPICISSPPPPFFCTIYPTHGSGFAPFLPHFSTEGMLSCYLAHVFFPQNKGSFNLIR